MVQRTSNYKGILENNVIPFLGWKKHDLQQYSCLKVMLLKELGYNNICPCVNGPHETRVEKYTLEMACAQRILKANYYNNTCRHILHRMKMSSCVSKIRVYIGVNGNFSKMIIIPPLQKTAQQTIRNILRILF